MKYLKNYNVEKNKECVIVTDVGEFPIWMRDFEKYFTTLEKGCEIDESLQETLITLASRRDIKKRAIRKLAAGDITKRGLIKKLLSEKVFSRDPDPEFVDELVSKLERAGYIDDNGFALRFASKCIEKKWGRKKISASMFEKGFDSETIRCAIEKLSPDFIKMAEDHIKEKLLNEEKETVYRRMTLRGFSYEEITSAFANIRED